MNEAELHGASLVNWAILLTPILVLIFLCVVNKEMKHKVKCSFFFGWLPYNFMTSWFCGKMANDMEVFFVLFIGMSAIHGVLIYSIGTMLETFLKATEIWEED